MTAQYDVNRCVWTFEVQQDAEGFMYIQLTDELLETMGWKAGDELLWERTSDGTWTIRKKP
jgi:hypothetical protein